MKTIIERGLLFLVARLSQTTAHAHTHTYRQFRGTNKLEVHVFGLREDAGENPK